MSDASEARYIDKLHWWSLADLARTEERIYPSDLSAILQLYLQQLE